MRIINLNLRRALSCADRDGSRSATVQIDRLEQSADGSWGCYWSFDPFQPEMARAVGEDAVGALRECFFCIGDLARSAQVGGAEIFWEFPGDQIGFGKIMEQQRPKNGDDPPSGAPGK